MLRKSESQELCLKLIRANVRIENCRYQELAVNINAGRKKRRWL